MLQLPDIPGDPGDVTRGNPFDGRHIAVLPMMRLRPVLNRQLKAPVCVMTRMVYFMDQRRPLIRTGCILSMAGSALGIEKRLSTLGDIG